jgi:4-hydroxy-tetrahydrodipicolinate synthase
MFEGTFTALVTPFTATGELDRDTLRKLVDRQIEAGITGLVPVGTTGESPTLTNAEHHEVIRVVVEQAAGRVPVIAGCGSNNTVEALEHTRFAKEAGAEASLHVAGYYNKPSATGFLRHFQLLADSVDLPLIVYNIPGRVGKNIDNRTMLALAEHPNIVGVKEASGDISQMMDLIRRRPPDFTVLSGDDEVTLPLMALGGNGVISVTSNLLPEAMVALVNRMLAGDTAAARAEHYKLLPVISALMGLDTNPIPVKAAMHLAGLVEERYRLPMTPLGASAKAELQRVLADYHDLEAAAGAA